MTTIKIGNKFQLIDAMRRPVGDPFEEYYLMFSADLIEFQYGSKSSINLAYEGSISSPSFSVLWVIDVSPMSIELINEFIMDRTKCFSLFSEFRSMCKIVRSSNSLIFENRILKIETTNKGNKITSFFEVDNEGELVDDDIEFIKLIYHTKTRVPVNLRVSGEVELAEGFSVEDISYLSGSLITQLLHDPNLLHTYLEQRRLIRP